VVKPIAQWAREALQRLLRRRHGHGGQHGPGTAGLRRRRQANRLRVAPHAAWAVWGGGADQNDAQGSAG